MDMVRLMLHASGLSTATTRMGLLSQEQDARAWFAL